MEKQETTLFSCSWPLSALIGLKFLSLLNFGLVKTRFHWYLSKNVWLLLDCFDCRSSGLTVHCPSVVVAVAQMSRFKGSGLGPEVSQNGICRLVVLEILFGSMCALLQPARTAQPAVLT